MCLPNLHHEGSDDEEATTRIDRFILFQARDRLDVKLIYFRAIILLREQSDVPFAIFHRQWPILIEVFQ